MKTKLTLCTAAAFCTLFSAVLPGSASAPSSAARQEIQSDFRRFTRAETTLKYDRIKPVVESFFSPHFILQSPHGTTLNYAQFLKEMQAVTTENRAVRENAFYPQTFTQSGNTLTETGVYAFSRTFIDVDQDFGPLNKPHSLNERTRYRSVWLKTNGRWQLQSIYLFGRTQIVDGKKFVEGQKHG